MYAYKRPYIYVVHIFKLFCLFFEDLGHCDDTYMHTPTNTATHTDKHIHPYKKKIHTCEYEYAHIQI